MTNDQDLVHVSQDVAVFLAKQLRGITTAQVRFVGTNPAFEEEFTRLVMALGVSVVSDRFGPMVPPPTRQISAQFKGDSAVLTVVTDWPTEKI
ncbi:hypothetical protein [Paracoccus yeei]|jgi:hypothetical protein|uniref:hypothetical protein n=1 Tax=Paracoccus yeei TaxID=147645 RepID=UPI003BF79491